MVHFAIKAANSCAEKRTPFAGKHPPGDMLQLLVTPHQYCNLA